MENDEVRTDCNPIKVIDDVVMIDGVSVRRESVLTATSLTGIKTVKKILVDDRDGTYEESIDCGGKTLKNAGVTTYRCGLMTALCIDRLSNVLNGKVYSMRVGFIGNGRTNLQNCRAINELFGISEVVIRGSENNRGKNKEEFEKICGSVYVDETESLELLNLCDVVVVCTSSYEKKHLISADKLNNVRLIIVLDCGYVLDESFRETRVNLTDHIEQLMHYYDCEFPFDDKKDYEFKQMKKDNIGQYSGKKVTVYLHGIALGDAIVSEELIKNGEIKEEAII